MIRRNLNVDFSLVKQKKLVGGGDMTIVNQTVNPALAKLGYATHEVDQIVAWIHENYSVVGAPFLKDEHYSIFDCAVGTLVQYPIWVTSK